jgi:hypothetical protein
MPEANSGLFRIDSRASRCSITGLFYTGSIPVRKIKRKVSIDRGKNSFYNRKGFKNNRLLRSNQENRKKKEARDVRSIVYSARRR